MPIIIIVTFVIAALGLGGYFWESSRHTVEVQTPTPITDSVTPTPAPVTTPSPDTPKTAYTDGAYKADVSYIAPDGGDHGMTVSLTIKDDTVTASEVTFAESTGPTANFQSRFSTEYKSLVVGKPVSSIKLSRVAGASLTTNAWNNAQAKIEAQAQS